MGNLTKKISRGTKIAFATGEIGDNLAYQSFLLLYIYIGQRNWKR